MVLTEQPKQANDILGFIEFINETNARADIPAVKPIPAEKVARRRHYAHDFTSDSEYYLSYNKQGKPYWRSKRTGSIVFYGKQQSRKKHHRDARTGKIV